MTTAGDRPQTADHGPRMAVGGRPSAVKYFKLGLIGYPISHSLSPRMHNAALRALQLAGDYTAIAVTPEALRETLPDLIARGYHGLNVTIPHKQAVMPLLDDLSEAARAIGAVNTIVVARGQTIGHNTDAVGFMRGLGQARFDARDKSVLVLGAGGAARAVVFALQRAGARVTIWNRTRERSTQLAREFETHVIDDLLPPPRCGAFDLIVNATAVGMTPRDAESPMPLLGRGVGAKLVYDLVYQPRETALLHEARGVGAQTIGGLDMLIYQGAEAFCLWTGRDAPIEAMRGAVCELQVAS